MNWEKWISIVIAPLINWLEAKVVEEDWNQARAVAFDFVSAAEQMDVVHPGNEEDARFNYAVKMLTEYVSRHGIDVNEGEVEALVEAAVLAVNRIRRNR